MEIDATAQGDLGYPVRVLECYYFPFHSLSQDK